MTTALKTISLFVLIIFSTFTDAWCQSADECRYLSALTYLHSNAEINSRIKSVFPKLFRKSQKYVDFNVSSRIDFLNIDYFEGKLSSEHGINAKYLENPKLYKETNNFNSIESEFLKQLNIRSDTKLYLTFSKPVDNYLIAEIGNFDPEINRNVKFGLGMQIFFKFGSNGLVEEAIHAVSAYN